MANDTDVIEVAGLVKRFGSHRALDGLEISVRPSEIHGFLGPNGSGKTTTLRVLLGLLRADAGSVRLLGSDPWHDAVALHRRIGYVPGEVSLWPNLTGGEVIDLLTDLRGGADRARKHQLVEAFRLDPAKMTRTYSKGNRQKVALVAALACTADLLILDEPTAGLDPLMESVFQQRIHEMRADGCTVLLSSHILAEVEALCDRVTIIRDGRTVDTGTLADLRHLTRTTISAQLTATADVAALRDHAGVHGLTTDGDRVTFDVEADALPLVLTTLGGLGVRSITSRPPSLEQLFLRHYSDEPAAEAVPVTEDAP